MQIAKHLFKKKQQLTKVTEFTCLGGLSIIESDRTTEK